MKYILMITIIFINFSAKAFNVWTDPEQGAFLIGKVSPTSTIYYDGQRIKTANDGRFLMGLDRDAPKKITIIEKRWHGQVKEHVVRIKERKWDVQKINGIDSKKITPPESEIARIQKESGWIKKAKEYSMERYFPTCFIRPIARSTRISGVFGSQRIYNGIPKSYHGGIDYAAPKGTEVRATAKGRVVLAYGEGDGMYYNGKTVIIDHGFGLFSTYIHLSRVMVKPGEMVKQGETIGTVGSTGRSTGPHLHFGIDWNGVKIDPQTAITNSVCD